MGGSCSARTKQIQHILLKFSNREGEVLLTDAKFSMSTMTKSKKS